LNSDSEINRERYRAPAHKIDTNGIFPYKS